MSVQETNGAGFVARVSLQAGLFYSFFEGISYYANFPVSSVADVIESSLRNLAIFFVIGMVSYPLLYLAGKLVRCYVVEHIPRVLSLLILFPVYFFLLYLLEGSGIIYHYIKNPKVIVLLLTVAVLVLFFLLTRIMKTRVAGEYSGWFAGTFFFITIGYRHVDWGSLVSGELSGILSLLVIVIIAVVMSVLIIRIRRLLFDHGLLVRKRAGLGGPLSIVLGLCVILFAWIEIHVSRGEKPISIANRPNVLLVVLDSARLDRFSCYGYERETTPFLDSFCSRANRYTEAITAAPWTMPSHASIFTGLFPSAHGMTWKNLYLDSRFLTLPEFLASKGYETVGFCNNPWVNEDNGLARGFETYVEMWKDEVLNPTLYYRLDWFSRRILGKNDGGALRTNQWVMKWMDRRYRGDQPFFLFINFMECHLWYDAPDAYHEMFLSGGISPAVKAIRSNSLYPLLTGYLSLTDQEWREYGDIYDGDLHYLDKRLEELFGYLSSRSYLDNTIVVITSDHGEHLGERHFVDHQLSLYEPLLRVPLIIRVPEGLAELLATGEPVQTVDLFPTLMELLGYREEIDGVLLQGVSLVGRKSSPNLFTVSEYEAPEERITSFLEAHPEGTEILKYNRTLKSIRVDSLKYIWSSDGNSELYNLVLDPGESADLRDERPVIAAGLEERLKGWFESFEHAGGSKVKGNKLDRETRQKLRALGYID